MSWLGIGLVTEHRTLLASLAQANAAPALPPGAGWTGAAGSGFATTPVDPVRTTAKPALHLLTPPQRFTGTLDVGALAMANDGGSLFETLGVEKVVFHYEGTSLDVTEPNWQTVRTERGPRTYFGWWARLAPAATGNANLYIEAVPRDPAMQRRVIGPFFFDPVSQIFTHSVNVAASQSEIAGERYQTLDAAIAHVNGFGAASPNPLITIAEPGTYDITRSTGTNMTAARGYLNITASVPGVSLGKAAYANDAAARLQNGRYKLHLFGENLAIDMRHITEVDGSTEDNGNNHWLDGITIATSGTAGRASKLRGAPPNRSTCVRSFPFACEVDFLDVRNPSRNFKLVRGCHYERIAADVANETQCFVFSTIADVSGKPDNNESNAFTVSYSGPETTATLAFPGGLHSSGGGGLFTLTLGSTAHTFDVGSGQETYFLGTAAYRGASNAGGYWHQDVIDWLNSFPGVTATRQIAEERAAYFSTLPGTVGVGWNTASIKDTVLQVATIINTHGDVYQHNVGLLENVIFAFNYGTDLEAQIWFLSPTGSAGAAPENDIMIVGNAMRLGTEPSTYFDPANASSQLGRGNAGSAISHVVVAHNTMPNQGWLIRTNGVFTGFTADQFCTFTNNIMRRFVYDGESLPLENLTVDGLLIHADELVPPGAINVVRAGDEATLVADFANGDYRAAGAALLNGFAAAIPTDLTRMAMPATAAPGAYAAAATAYAPPALSTTPEADLIAAMNAVSGGDSFFLDFREGVLAGGTLTVRDQSANGNDASQSDSASRPALSFNGAVFSSSNFLSVPISGGVFTIVAAFTKADTSTTGTIASDQALNNNGVNYQDGTISAPSVNVFVDGEAVGTRDRWHDLMHEAGEVVITIDDFDFTGDTELRIGRPSGALTGEVRRVIGIKQGDFPTTLPLVRSLAQQVAAIGYEEPPPPDPDADIIEIVSEAGGKSGVYDMALGVVVGSELVIGDLSDNGNNITQLDSARRPAIGSGGATFAVDDWLGLTISGGTFTVVMSLTKDGTSTGGNIISDQAANSGISQYSSSSTNALNTVNRVNGTVAVNRQALYNALHGAGEVALTVEAIDAAGDTQLRIGRGSSGGYAGVVRRAVILDHTAHGADLGQAAAAAVVWVNGT
jgi:hypothetical protein